MSNRTLRASFLFYILYFVFSPAGAQNEVLQAAQKANDYFMAKYSDPTLPTNVKKVRPSSLWTRAVYYEGLMALNAVAPQQRYIDYALTWANFHKWTPRNGVNTCDADDQCCGQTYVELLPYTGKSYQELLGNVIANLDHQMVTANDKKNATAKTKSTQPSLYGWWTWIDAIQMAMPVYAKMYAITGDKQYLDYAMKSYEWSRNTCGGGLLNTEEGLWWRDKDFVPPYKEKDGQNCYWSRGNGWVYVALIRSMQVLSPKEKAYKMIRQWNEELRAKGYATVNGRVSRQYYLEHMYGMTENTKEDWRMIMVGSRSGSTRCSAWTLRRTCTSASKRQVLGMG